MPKKYDAGHILKKAFEPDLYKVTSNVAGWIALRPIGTLHNTCGDWETNSDGIWVLDKPKNWVELLLPEDHVNRTYLDYSDRMKSVKLSEFLNA